MRELDIDIRGRNGDQSTNVELKKSIKIHVHGPYHIRSSRTKRTSLSQTDFNICDAPMGSRYMNNRTYGRFLVIHLTFLLLLSFVAATLLYSVSQRTLFFHGGLCNKNYSPEPLGCLSATHNELASSIFLIAICNNNDASKRKFQSSKKKYKQGIVEIGVIEASSFFFFFDSVIRGAKLAAKQRIEDATVGCPPLTLKRKRRGGQQ